MLFLGIFVGTIITVGVIKTKDWTKLQGLLVTLLGSALSGSVFGFIDYLGGQRLGDALFNYPVGLVLGMMWAFVAEAAENIRRGYPWLGWLHIAGVVLATILTLLILFSPAFRKLLPKNSNQDTPPAPNHARLLFRIAIQVHDPVSLRFGRRETHHVASHYVPTTTDS